MSKEVTLEEMLDIDKRVITIDELYSLLSTFNKLAIKEKFNHEDYVPYPDLIQFLKEKVGENGFIILDHETNTINFGIKED